MFPASIYVYLHVCVCFCVHKMNCNNKIKDRREELRQFSLYKFHNACTFVLCWLNMDVNVLCLTMDVKFGKFVPNFREPPTTCRRGCPNRKTPTVSHASTCSHDKGSLCTSPPISSPADSNRMISASVLALSAWSWSRGLCVVSLTHKNALEHRTRARSKLSLTF